ncbi:MAG: DUF4199 family protein [Crocinitomicaceae bacterium]|jgi:hypothetical protein|nr:DUF4199 family protein [Crocinitomicaceae bacterium]MDP4684290.1 DUF4199 family protein [Crocinitomicaceae bacterium]MDP4798188.1 DUF4199 family protein [Crocinitomicaceae bacterium]MDP4867236.1 DUF4199 family protein [Crocinitomicaceae bacterium]MDP5009633.1 DUF4199 family protein [Crocinitomicaceae bacterium]
MRITVKTGMITALVWIGIKMLAFATGIVGSNVVPLVMLNILGVLLAISIGLFLHKKKTMEDSNALLDIKNAMSAGVPYVMLVSIFLYFYYAKIDPEFNAHQIAEFETTLQRDLDDPIKFQQIKESNEDFEVKSKKEIYDTLRSGPRAFYSPGSTMAISMLSLLLLATLNSIFVTIVYRKFIFRRQ